MKEITESQLKEMAAAELQLMVENGEIDEGVFSRMATRAKAGLGKVKDVAGGTVKGGIAGLKGDVAGVKAATKQRTQAGAKAEAIKAVRTVKVHMNALKTDLEKLGVDTKTGQVGTIIKKMEALMTGTLAKKAGMA
tara:strand:+ start:299 stop:706 length:408 start_codon:yes stop_codon:yes gene_type:complete